MSNNTFQGVDLDSIPLYFGYLPTGEDIEYHKVKRAFVVQPLRRLGRYLPPPILLTEEIINRLYNYLQGDES